MMNFIPCSTLVENIEEPVPYICIVNARRILMLKDVFELPRIPVSHSTSFWQIGILNGVPCIAVDLSQWNDNLPANSEWIDLRTVLHICPSETVFAVSRAVELLSWRAIHQFCGKCGNKLIHCQTEVSLCCPNCDAHYYPQIAPAMITLITRGEDEILLAHNRKFPDGIYSLISGFIEAGETAEQAVHREIREEVGITVNHLRYAGSQCWPYPNSLMLGFTAQYEAGIVTPDSLEIESAAFFTRKNMPHFPAPGSISFLLINAWIQHKLVL